MSNTAGLAIPLHGPSRVANGHAATVDVNAVHYYWFGRRLWLAGLGKCVQALLLLAAGVFLLTQISSTPNLVVQIALTGSLLTAGGAAMLYRALGDFLAGMKVDRQWLKIRTGWKSVSVPWSKVEKWRIEDHVPKIAQLPCITLWLAEGLRPVTIASGNLDERSRSDIRELFQALAYSKESA